MSLTYGTLNLAWQLGGDSSLLRAFAPTVDVGMLVECRTKSNHPIDVKKYVGRDFRVYQNLDSAAEAGTAIIVRKGTEVKRARHVLVTPGNSEVQARYRWTVVLKDQGPVRVTAFHNPLASTGLQDEAIAAGKRQVAAARRWRSDNPKARWIWGGDANMRPEEWADHLNAPFHYGAKPMVLCWSTGWGAVKTSQRSFAGSDHRALYLDDR